MESNHVIFGVGLIAGPVKFKKYSNIKEIQIAV